MNLNISQELAIYQFRKTHILVIVILISIIIGYFFLKEPLLAVVIVPAFFVSLFVLRKPEILLWILIFAAVAAFPGRLFSHHISIGSINIYLVDILLFCFFLLALLSNVVTRRTRDIHIAIGIPLIIFFILGFFALLRGVPFHGEHAFHEFRPIFDSILYFSIVMILGSLFQIQKTIRVFFLASLAIILFGCYNLLFGTPTMLSSIMSERYLWGSQSIFLAFSVIFSLCLLLFKVVHHFRWFLITVIIAQSIGILLALFRSTWLGLIVALVFMGLMVTKSSKAKLILFLGVILVMSLLVLSVGKIFTDVSLANPVIKNIQSIPNYKANPTAQWRLTAWKNGFDMVRRHLFWGNGFGESFSFYSPVSKKWIESSPHNMYLWITIKMGFVGLIVFIWMNILFFRTGIKVFKNMNNRLIKAYLLGLMSIYMCLLVAAFFKPIFGMRYLGIFIWIIPGLTMALIKIVDKEKLGICRRYKY